MVSTETYKGKTITLDPEANPPKLSIDGETMTVVKHSDNAWWTPRFAHQVFGTLDDLAKTMVDSWGG